MSKFPGRVITDLAPAGYSVAFDGTGDYLSLTQSAFAVGTSNFTLEAWVYLTAAPGTEAGVISSFNTGGGQGFYLAVNSSRQPFFAVGNGATSNPTVTGTAISLNTWVHLAGVRSSNTLTLYVNGTSVGTPTSATASIDRTLLGIGLAYPNSPQGYITGYISNARVTSSALYTAAFTPPTQLFNITNTSLLTCNSPAIIDQSNNTFAITVNGNAAVSTLTPFTAYVPYNPALGASTPGIWTVDEAMQAAATRQWNMYDPYFNLNTLLLHGNGTNGAQNNTFLDSSSNNFTITRNPASGPNAPTQGSFSPFSAQPGAWSSYYSGVADTNGTYFAANAAYSFGTGDFTVEAWINIPPISNTNGKAIVDSRPSGFNGPYWFFGFTNTGQLVGVTMTTGGTTITSTSAIPTNQWVHVAYTRASGTLNLWVNGVSVASATGNTNNISSDTLWVGRNAFSGVASDTWFSGYMSNLRIVKGVAIYTGTFTPPASPLEKTQSAGINIAAITGSQTSLLFNQSNRFVDNSNTNATPLTLNTWPTIQSFSPFYPTAAYTPQTIGGSGFFDGTGDFLTIPDSSAFTLGNSNFCIELWIYPTVSMANYANFIGQWANATTNCAYTFRTSLSNAVQFAYTTNGNGQTGTVVDGTALRIGSWNHIVVCRSGVNLAIFQNGARTATNNISTNTISDSTRDQQIGFGTDGGAITGYMSSLRMVVGSAVYDPTQTTLPIPTAPLTAIANTQLLLNFTNAGIVDSTAKNVLETVGNAQISTTQSKFGGTSMSFDGTGDYLISNSGTDLYAFGSGDFTIEMWVNFAVVGSSGVYTLYDSRPNGTQGAYASIALDRSTAKIYYYVSSAIRITGSVTIVANTWYHVAICRSGTSTRLFVNGTQDGSTWTDTTTYLNPANRPVIAASGSSIGTEATNGYIDELRVTKGFARYTGNFTPQTSQWQDQ